MRLLRVKFGLRKSFDFVTVSKKSIVIVHRCTLLFTVIKSNVSLCPDFALNNLLGLSVGHEDTCKIMVSENRKTKEGRR